MWLQGQLLWFRRRGMWSHLLPIADSDRGFLCWRGVSWRIGARSVLDRSPCHWCSRHRAAESSTNERWRRADQESPGRSTRCGGVRNLRVKFVEPTIGDSQQAGSDPVNLGGVTRTRRRNLRTRSAESRRYQQLARTGPRRRPESRFGRTES